MRRRPAPWLVWAAALVAAVAVPASQPPASAEVPDELLGASSAEHAWLVLPVVDELSEHSLLHHAASSRGPHVSVQRKLSRMPRALAAWGPRLWILFDGADGSAAVPAPGAAPAPAPTAAHSRPEIYTLEVELVEGLGSWRTDPPDHFGLVPALSPWSAGTGVIAFVGTARGPAIVLGTASAPSASGDPGGPDRQLRLLQLEGASWHEVALPEAIAEPVYLAPPPDETGPLTLFAASAAQPSVTHMYRQGPAVGTAAPTWERSILPVDPATIHSAGRAGSALFMVTRTRPSAGPADLELSIVRPGMLLPLSRFAPPGEKWVSVGFAGGPRLFALNPRPAGRPGFDLALVTIDSLTGALGTPQVMTREPIRASQIWQIAFLLAIAVTVTLLVLVFRPAARRAPLKLPRGLRLISPGNRAIALAIDMVPSGAVALLLLDASPMELLRMPLFGGDLRDSSAYLLMAAITFLHGGISECLTGRTLGKALGGSSVLSSSGARPRLARLLLRNLVKLLVLGLPALGLLIFLSPNMQGVHDLAAGTIVASAAGEEETPADDR